jgi:NAD(P)-dependent dehydrogenase (short-subunit alcohol dehydrogenase family)
MNTTATKETQRAKDPARADPQNETTVVVGASRGLGRGIAIAFATAGVPVVALARTAGALSTLAGETGSTKIEVADGADPIAAASVLDRYNPSTVVIVAGATPVMRPLQDHTWETFSINWHTDVQIAFQWLRASLIKPLRPGGRVIVLSSGAAVAGSPLSGGYAGAKATQRFMTAYAQEEANRAGLKLTFTAVLPRMTPATELGRAAITAYAARGGQSQEGFLQRFGPPLTAERVGAAVLELARQDATQLAPAYLLTSDGLQQLG